MESDAGAGSGMLAALAEGPARLSPDGVAASQRRRMLAAMVAAVAEKGYVNVAVTDVVSRARVSRATFYEHFTDKADCFVAAFDACASHLLDGVRRRLESDLPPREMVHALLDRHLAGAMAFPEEARVCLVEVYAAGPEAVLHRRQVQLDFVRVFRETYDRFVATGAPVRPLTDFDFEALVGAISSLVTNRVAVGDVAGLDELLEPLKAFVLTHFGLPTTSGG